MEHLSGAIVAEAGRAESKGGRYYRPELDALRFFAFLCVFFFHASNFIWMDPSKHAWIVRIRPIGGFGVQIFFLLSAFLITELLFRERERTGRIHIASFYMRRILRIWPLYFLVLFGLALLNYFVPGTGTDNLHAWLAFTFLSGNWYIFRHGWISSSFDPLWSISVEEQFYLIIPMLASRGGRRAVLYISCVLLVVAYITVLFYGAHPNGTAEWTNSFVEFQFFCAGTLVALFLRGKIVPLIFPLRVAGFLAGLLCWLAATLILSNKQQHSPVRSVAFWLLLLVGTLILFLCTLGTPSSLVPSWLSYFGKISYGLYMVHSLVFFLLFMTTRSLSISLLRRNHVFLALFEVLEIVAALAVDLVLAHLSFVYFEGYFLRMKQRFTFVQTRD